MLLTDKPEIEDSPQYLKFASEAGDTGKLVCRSQASPLARYTWARNGSPINSNTTGKYYSTNNQVLRKVYIFHLFVTNFLFPPKD